MVCKIVKATYVHRKRKDFRINKTRLTPRQKAKIIARCAQEKKADDIVVLDMRKAANFCDYFVVCSGSSDRRIRAIADAIDDGLSQRGCSVRSREGFSNATWIVMDYGDVVAHLFDDEVRNFYNLERLWRDASVVEWKK